MDLSRLSAMLTCKAVIGSFHVPQDTHMPEGKGGQTCSMRKIDSYQSLHAIVRGIIMIHAVDHVVQRSAVR